MRRFFAVMLVCALVPALGGCGEHCESNCYETPDGGGGYYSGCPDGATCNSPDGGSGPTYTECWEDEDCRPGEVCAFGDQCMELVLDCPLTDECLPDPEEYVPDWQGIDPTYVGAFETDEIKGKVIVDVDFYEDHFYGEGWVDDGWSWWALPIAVTGSREGALLWGQAFQTDSGGREFDAVFDAELLSASEIVGTVNVASDDGEFSLDFTLLRTSPCGCDYVPGCLGDRDCPEGQTCEKGICVD